MHFNPEMFCWLVGSSFANCRVQEQIMQLEKEKHNKDKATLKKQDVGHSSLK